MPTKQQMQQERQHFLTERLGLWKSGKLALPKARTAVRMVDGVELKPAVKGLNRSNLITVKSELDRFTEMKPTLSKITKMQDRIKVPEPLNTTIAERTDDANQTYRRMWGIVQPEYNLLEPFTIFDTEPFVRQAVNRKLSLMFRNGFEIMSDQQKDADYINRRLEVMEYVMERDTQSFFTQVLYNLLLASNCFLQKIRKTESTPVKQIKGRKEPVAGYRLVPAHMIFPYLENGVPSKWRRYFETGAPFEDIDLDDIVHLKWDVKPGHRFGTPRLIGVKDDIFALRRLEENVELLFINHLFPLFHIKVGNEENPASFDEQGNSEVDLIKWQIENMPKEGVFVTDERVEAEVVGAAGKGLDPKAMIEHYKTRIFTGLGMSALDMGDGASANRATADNISQNLKDSIKFDLETFGGLVRLLIFKELFMEATYSVSVQKAVSRTKILFHEIDLDNKIKFENHVIQLFLNNLIDEDEARKQIGHKAFDEVQRKKLHFDLHVVRLVKETEKAKAESQMELLELQHEQMMEALPMQTEHAEKQASTEKGLLQAKAKHSEVTSAHKVNVLEAKTAHIKAGGGAPQRATAKKSSPAAKSVQNKTTPTNQHGSNLGPTKAQSALEGSASDFTDSLVELISEMHTESKGEGIDIGEWKTRSAIVIDEIANLLIDQSVESDVNSYTRQDRTGIDHLKALVATTFDPELIAVLVQSGLSQKAQDVRTDPSEYLAFSSSLPHSEDSSGTDLQRTPESYQDLPNS
jgi:hypothetical protein